MGPGSSIGTSVEVFVPSTGQQCRLPDLPENRRRHTMEKMTVCGGMEGRYIETSCLTLSNGIWDTTTTLQESRLYLFNEQPNLN